MGPLMTLAVSSTKSETDFTSVPVASVVSLCRHRP